MKPNGLDLAVSEFSTRSRARMDNSQALPEHDLERGVLGAYAPRFKDRLRSAGSETHLLPRIFSARPVPLDARYRMGRRALALLALGRSVDSALHSPLVSQSTAGR